ncbi:uncharacterized protein UBRO_20378 [Ustilago bromivora]|uniref:Uncharacterized protein n=1 Tax=Ustilago bromivora TaxID=307758 RepID=A0A1K0G6K0_9BASI|nr:uncharacterized protein UBRO_20378 [Ustilago bromivora]
MAPSYTRIVSLLLLLAIHAVGVVSAWGFGWSGSGGWPKGQVLTAEGFRSGSSGSDSELLQQVRNTMLAKAARNQAQALFNHGIPYILDDKEVELRERHFDRALNHAKQYGAKYVGNSG